MITTPYSGLITKGLGLPALAGFITYHFSLFVLPYTPPPPPPPTKPAMGGGGHVPFGLARARGSEVGMNRSRSVQMRNVPINYLKKQNDVPANVVVMTIKFGDKQYKKEYITTQNKANVVIKVIGLFNSAKKAIKVVAEGLFGWINKTKSGDK